MPVAWKARTGGQVVATMCTYTPEEILIAAGMLPVRVLGAHEPQNVTEPHIFGMFCPFCRDSLAQGLLGRYEYCEGVTLTQSCIQYRQTFNSWRMHVPTVKWDYYLPMPNEVQSRFAKTLHYAEVKKFREFMEGVIGKKLPMPTSSAASRSSTRTGACCASSSSTARRPTRASPASRRSMPRSPPSSWTRKSTTRS
jgi:bzd-type benzoyl-CoA reductase N subunit